MITMSVEELIRIEFDRFYENIKFKGLDVPSPMEEALKDLENAVVENAMSDYTTEMEEAKEDAYDHGWENGREQGYDEGFNEGHDIGYHDAKEECEKCCGS